MGKHEVKDRRKHGCDGCHQDVPTQRFDGTLDDNLYLCSMCVDKLILGRYKEVFRD